MSARTARRRRKQAKMGYRHLAKLGKRGSGTSRPIYHAHTSSVLDAREAAFRERNAQFRMRQSRAAHARKGGS